HELLETGMEENRDTVFIQERTSYRNLRRRARYAQMSPERKQLFLSQLRKTGLNQKDKNSFINQICLLNIYSYKRNSNSTVQGADNSSSKIILTRKDFECPKCNRKTTLVPRCIFQIDLIDGTVIAISSISGELGEKLLFMTAEDIFGITCVKLRKSYWSSTNNTHTTLSILSYVEKE
ncbi:hypothetical protein H5410_035777, partial [Solanum commersonii]